MAFIFGDIFSSSLVNFAMCEVKTSSAFSDPSYINTTRQRTHEKHEYDRLTSCSSSSNASKSTSTP